MSETAPSLHTGLLSSAQLVDYRRDLEALGRVLAVIPKRGRRDYASGVQPSLEDGLASLVEGSLRGLQVRYLYDGHEWWDTLIRDGDGVRLVRVDHGQPRD